MTDTTKQRIEQADKGAKHSLKALSALFAEQNLDPQFIRAVKGSLESAMELTNFIEVVRREAEPVELKKQEGGE